MDTAKAKMINKNYLKAERKLVLRKNENEKMKIFVKFSVNNKFAWAKISNEEVNAHIWQWAGYQQTSFTYI